MTPVASDRRSQILQAAFAEFAAKGVRGATIKSIAAAAGLMSTASIYWYFPAKEALFQAVIEAHAPAMQVGLDLEALVDYPPEEVLPLLAHTLVTMAGQPYRRQLWQLLFGEAMRRPEVGDTLVAAGLARGLDVFGAYLARQVAAGRLRPHDTRTSARAFLGMLLPRILGDAFFPALLVDAPTTEEHIVTAVAIVLGGLRPEVGGAPDASC